MRVASVETGGRTSYGILTTQGFCEADRGLRESHPDLRALLSAGSLAALPGRLSGTVTPREEIRFLPVVPNPSKILCVGVNFRPHVEEMGRTVPEHPVVFVRFANSLVGHGEPLNRPAVSEHYDFEGELAVVIGKRARYVKAADAADVIAGYCPFFDGSVRDWQRHTTQFTAGKNFPASGAAGPALVTPDEVTDLESVQLTTAVNGELMQRGRISELIFGIPELIEYCSAFTELEPGDVIATGTPGGVGAAQKPPRWLVPGDTVSVDLGVLGCLENTVQDEVAAA